MPRKKKPTFTVVVYWSQKSTYEVTADDSDYARDKAIEMCEKDHDLVNIDDAVVENCDYPDHQELLDRDNEGRVRL